MNKNSKSQIAGYGLHYHANSQLLPNLADRTILQCLVDLVRRQLNESLDNQTIVASLSRLGNIANMEAYHTLPASLLRLEKLGLIKKYKNGVRVNCDEYVSLVKAFEASAKKKEFAADFNDMGIDVLKKYGIPVIFQCRTELLQQSGSSIVVDSEKYCKITAKSGCEVENTVNLQYLGNDATQNTEIFQDFANQIQKPCNFSGFSDSEVENPEIFQWSVPSEYFKNPEKFQDFMQRIAETLKFFSIFYTVDELLDVLTPEIFQYLGESEIMAAYYTGNFPKKALEKPCNFSGMTPEIFQDFAKKVLKFFRTDIIVRIKRKINETFPFFSFSQVEVEAEVKQEKISSETKEDDDDFQLQIKEGFENFGKVEVMDFDNPSVEDQVEAKPIEDLSQLKLKRAERSLRARNIYRNKPFIPVDKVKETVECLDEVVKTPVDFFLYQFWWGIYDLYCDHYNPSVKIDEEGELVEESQSFNWKEMIGASLPQDEVYSLAENVYEDLRGAVELGKYVYGESNEWEVKFQFSSFEDFSPCEMFQWKPCTMQDKSIPALEVAIDRFYDISAPDVITPTKADKKTKNAQNKLLINLIMDAEGSSVSLTPMEKAIQAFYKTFVKAGEDWVIDDFVDDKRMELECTGRLPDHIFKVWCYCDKGIGYGEFTSVLTYKYKPIDGVRRKAYIFSAELVAEWNERHGFFDTVAHRSLKAVSAED